MYQSVQRNTRISAWWGQDNHQTFCQRFWDYFQGQKETSETPGFGPIECKDNGIFVQIYRTDVQWNIANISGRPPVNLLFITIIVGFHALIVHCAI